MARGRGSLTNKNIYYKYYQTFLPKYCDAQVIVIVIYCPRVWIKYFSLSPETNWSMENIYQPNANKYKPGPDFWFPLQYVFKQDEVL